MRPPTFVIAGAQRCGTTWLYHALGRHPQIYMAKPADPEPKFFVTEPDPPRDRAWYLEQWFRPAAEEIAVGEKSTSYMEFPEAPRRMQALFPG